MKTVAINGHKIGPDQPTFIIAEAGVNHNGDLNMARQLIDVAVEAGADAVKFQTFKTENVLSKSAPKAEYQAETTGSDESQFDMVKKFELPHEAFAQLMEYCVERGIMFLSSPFDEESIDLLGELGVNAFKVPSGEITNLPYLARMARWGKPMIVSTGMAYLSEVEVAIRTIKEANSETDYVLLQCLSNYPADPANVNLKAMHTMTNAFDVPVGYSDHTPGIEVTLAAVAMGARAVEKHFTLDNDLPGPDHRASLEPDELSAMVTGIRIVESAIGHGRKEPSPSEADTAAVARKSLISARYIPMGAAITEDMIAIKRPGTGMAPAMRDQLLGRSAKVDIPADTLLTMEMIG